ncbi:hypothetical protein FH972_006583 [Carpinus fangiana]|uniref:RRM domain-containing protein n=1 Tax=Carpinus fangiana TaxID=176857 RepID=A0A5N6QVP2_9ROSI|nr:hypothetical protein FH972_006583 [Carpinus fangiana]
MDIKVKWIPRKLNQGANRVVNKAIKSNIQDHKEKGSDELDETITYQTWMAMYGDSQIIKKWIDAGTIHYHANELEKKDELTTTFWTIIRNIHELIGSRDSKVKWIPRKLNQTTNRVVNKVRKSNIQDHEDKGSDETITYQTWITMYGGSQVNYKRGTDQSRGFGFITISTVEEAEKVVEMFHHYSFPVKSPLSQSVALPPGITPLSSGAHPLFSGELFGHRCLSVHRSPSRNQSLVLPPGITPFSSSAHPFFSGEFFGHRRLSIPRSPSRNHPISPPASSSATDEAIPPSLPSSLKTEQGIPKKNKYS